MFAHKIQKKNIRGIVIIVYCQQNVFHVTDNNNITWEQMFSLAENYLALLFFLLN